MKRTFTVLLVLVFSLVSRSGFATPLSESEAFAEFMTEVAQAVGGTVNLEWEIRTPETEQADQNTVLNQWLSTATLQCEEASEASAVTEIFLPLEDQLGLTRTHRGRAQYDFIMGLSHELPELCGATLSGPRGSSITLQTLDLGHGEKLILGLADHG